MKNLFFLLFCLCLACNTPNKETKKSILPEVPENAEAISFFEKPLYSKSLYETTQAKYEAVKAAYEADPENVDKLIWLGRWTAYRGDFREAIKIYSAGIEKFPDDARLYRHRGHRYISIRALDRAISDLEYAAQLIAGKADEVEPDGQPNAQNIPTSTLHTNIWYHLGLAYYLKNDLPQAQEAYRKCVAAATNDDMLVASLHWYYMILRQSGQTEAAQQALEPVNAKMNIIENFAYFRLCLLYKGELSVDDLTEGDSSSIENAALAYGIGNWYVYHNDPDQAESMFSNILKGKSWAAFGYLAAEAYLARQ